jgi:Septum formation
MRCGECGAESAELAQLCARCGAPAALEASVAADQAEAGSGDSSAPLPGESLHQTAGQHPEPSSRRNALVLAGLGFVVLVAVTVLVASVTTIITRLSTSTSSKSPPRSASSNSPKAPGSPTASGPPSPSASQLTYDQLRAGDCVQVPNINTASTWPDVFTVVPCSQSHTGEVFFAGDIWPQSIAYPGDNATDKQADARCGSAFTKYDGISPDQSAFTYAWDLPDSTSWLSGDRSVQCIAYDPSGAPLFSSIEGSHQ